MVLITALISGVSNFINKIAVTAVKEPIAYTTLKNVLVAAILIGVIVLHRKWGEIAKLNRKQIVQLILIGLVGGSIPFALYFTGLTKTSAINATLIHNTLFLWVLIVAVPLMKEKMAAWQWLGVGAIFVANLFVGGFSGFKFNGGELMILAATVMWGLETVIAKIALKDISSLTVAGARMVLGSVVLLAIVAWQGHLHLYSGLNTMQWGWTVVASLLLFGYVATWYTALKLAPATYIATLLVPATLVTNVLTAVFVTHTFPVTQVESGLLFIVGGGLVIYFARQSAIIADKTKIKLANQ